MHRDLICEEEGKFKKKMINVSHKIVIKTVCIQQLP